MAGRRNLTLLGSTGSIGRSVLDVVGFFPDRFRVCALAAGKNIEVLIDQVRRCEPRMVSVASAGDAEQLRSRLLESRIRIPEILYGPEGAIVAATLDDVHMVVAAISGAAGLVPTFHAVRAGKTLALANKETLVMAGDLILPMAAAKGCAILPVDSEHNALHQCLQAVKREDVDALILTASGGPCLDLPADGLPNVSVSDALNHPTWRMGRKITIDSATLMNKGLEIIEAHHLFGMPAEKIEVLIHPQSVVHSMVRIVDGSLIAQLGVTDMRLPILYALTYPDRVSTPLPRLDLTACGTLTFRHPDKERFPCLGLAYQALSAGGTMPAVLNAANEVAVDEFLQGNIRFTDIASVVERTMGAHAAGPVQDLDQVLDVDAAARVHARQFAQERAHIGNSGLGRARTG